MMEDVFIMTEDQEQEQQQRDGQDALELALSKGVQVIMSAEQQEAMAREQEAMAREQDADEKAAILEENGPGLFIDAVKKGRWAEVEQWLYAGAEPNTKAVSSDIGVRNIGQGVFPLLWLASKNNDFKTVKVLIEASADVNAVTKNRMQHTALIKASKEGYARIVKLLIEHSKQKNRSLNLDLQSNFPDGRVAYTALIWACDKGYEEIAKRLIDAGANIHLKDGKDGKTALHWAAENGHEAIVGKLLEGGAVVNEPDGQGRTALHWAAEKGHAAIVGRLLEGGAVVNEPDGQGRTALHWAAEKGHAAIVDRLLVAGAAVNRPDGQGRTALDLAAQHPSIISMLEERELNRAIALSLAGASGGFESDSDSSGPECLVGDEVTAFFPARIRVRSAAEGQVAAEEDQPGSKRCSIM